MQRAMASYSRAYRPAGTARQLVAVAADGDRSPLLHRIVAPTRVIHGEADPLVPVPAAHDLVQQDPRRGGRHRARHGPRPAAAAAAAHCRGHRRQRHAGALSHGPFDRRILDGLCAPGRPRGVYRKAQPERSPVSTPVPCQPPRQARRVQEAVDLSKFGLGAAAAAAGHGLAGLARLARPPAVTPPAECRRQSAAADLRRQHRGAGHLLGRQPAAAGVRLALPVRLCHGAAAGAAPGFQLPHRLAYAAPAPTGGCGDDRVAAARASPAGRCPGAGGCRDAGRRCLRARPAPWPHRPACRCKRRRRPARRRGRGLGGGGAVPCLLRPFARRAGASGAGRRLGRGAAAVQDLPGACRCAGAGRWPRHGRCGRAAAGFDRGALGTLLWHTAGVSLRSGGIAFRTSPSSGALFSTELYVAVRQVAGPGAGPVALRRERRTRCTRCARARPTPGAGPEPGGPAARRSGGGVATAIFRRSGHKYRDRSYRYVLADLGHALENLRVAAQVLGLEARLQPWFDEAPAAATLGVDPAEEGVLALAVLIPAHGAVAWPLAAGGLRRGHAAAAALRGPDRAAPAWQPPLAGRAASAPLGLTDAMHRATSLRERGAGVRTARAGAAAAGHRDAPTAVAGAARRAAAGGDCAPAAVRRYADRPLSAAGPRRPCSQRRGVRRAAVGRSCASMC